MKTRLRGHLRTYSSHILVAVLTLAFFSSVYTALAVNYVTPGLTLDPGADFPVLCADPLNDCTTKILRIGNPIGGATSGSIPFVDASGNLAEDNSNLFWDETNNRLGIGTNTPASRLDISTSAISPAVVGAATEINGGLLDDLTSGGTYTGLNDNTIYVYVDSPGATDTFAWADLNGDFPGDFGIPITPGPITLTGTGVTVTFGATTGHDGGELWEIPVTASAVVTSGDFNFGGSLLKGGSLWAGAIGGVVDNATANSVPFIDASGNLAEDTLFTYDSSTTLLSVNAINIPNTTSSSQGVIQKNGSRFFHTYNTGVSNENLFIGVNAGNFTLTAPGAFKNANNGIGQNALSSLTTGFFNTAVGTSALRRMTTGSNNTAVGLQALNNAQIAVDSIAIGESALFGGSGIGTLTGGKNVAIGNAALYDTTSGANNTALGYHAGLSVNSGSNNIFIGLQAGDSLTTGSNNIALGYDIDLPSSTGSNQLSIGNLIFGSAIDGTGATISSGNIGIGDATPDFRLDVEQTTDGVVATFADNDNNCTIDPDVVGGISCTSDARRKENVVTIDDALTDIRKLRTVSYDFIGDGDSSSIGFIAQEVEDIYPSLIVRNPNGYLTLSYAGLTPMLTRAIQELDIQITDLTALTGDTGLGLLDAIKNWLADTANGIQNIFAKRVTTDELCIEDVCVTRDQFLQLLENAGVDGTNDDTPPVPEEPVDENSGEDSIPTDNEGDVVPPDEPQEDPEPVLEEPQEEPVEPELPESEPEPIPDPALSEPAL